MAFALARNNYIRVYLAVCSLLMSLLVSGCGGGSSPTNTSTTSDNNTPDSQDRYYSSLTTGRYPSNMYTNNNFLFWSENSLTPINKISLLDGQYLRSYLSSIGVEKDYLIAGQYIYWIDDQYSNFGKCFIKQSSLDGRTTNILYQVTNATWYYSVQELYADATNLYWIESLPDPNGMTTSSTIQQVKRMSLEDGVTQVVYSTDITVSKLTGDDTSLYWVETTLDMKSLDSLHRIGKDSGEHQVLLSDQLRFTAKPLIVDDKISLALITGSANAVDYVYSLATLPKSGGDLQILYSYTDYWASGHSIREMATDNAYLYWVEYSSVKKIAISGGQAITLESSVPSEGNGNVSLTLFGENVFWADDKVIKSVPTVGGLITTWMNLYFSVKRIMSDSSGIYWDEWGNVAHPTVRIARLDPSNYKIDTMVTGIGSFWHPFSVDSSNLFVADGETIKKVPITGGRTELVLTKSIYQNINNVYTDGTSVYFLTQQELQKFSQTTGAVVTVASDLVCDNAGHRNDSLFMGRYLYCVDAGSVSSGDKFFRVSLDTGDISNIATNIGYVSEWTTDGNYLFYSDQNTGNVYKVSVSGGEVTKIFTTNGWDITKLASDGQFLYWINQTKFAKTDIASGSTEYIYLGLTGSAYEIMVDENSIYWSVNGLNDGRIYLATPK